MKRPSAVAIVTIVGTVLMSLGFTLLLTTPVVTYADEPQETIPFEDYACLNCHTDQERLKELAPNIPVEEESSLSSGPG